SGALLLLMIWTQRHAAAPAGSPPRKRLIAAAAGFSIVFLWSFVQIGSWTPAAWHHPLWIEAQTLLGDVAGAVAVDRGVVAESLLRFSGYIACFLLAFVAARDGARAKLIVITVAGAGVAYAAYGLIAQSMGGESILWFKKWAYQGFLTSTFVNKNSYAAYAGFGLICCLPLIHQHFKHKTADAVLAKRSKAAAFFAALTLKDYAILFAPLVILAALALTGSRAGVASSLLGVFGYFIAMAVHNRKKSRGWVWLATVGLALFVGFVAMGGDALQERLDQNKMGEDFASRAAAYQLEAQAIGDNPWLGFGLGSFDGAFKLYRDSTLQNWFHHAHNDYLEMIMDLGFPVALILFLSLALLISACASGLWQRRRDAHFTAIALGASLLVMTHALVDFSLHIPAIAATYAALLGVGVAQSWSVHKKNGEKAGSLR
ncbi:MAG TPA: hypothetical protein DCY07_04205, partial [Rhodospirillaceae bacterium]|nr:hypothetical protein [Rhodospirillaceae bacterium]